MQDLNITEINYYDDNFNKQFRNLENGQLTMTQFVLLNQAYNRIDLSRKQDDDDYYDTNYHDYFAIITQDEIMKKFDIRNNAITSAFQALEKKGYLIRKKAKSGAMKLFAPHLSFIVNKSPNVKNQTGQSGKSSTNQRDSIYTYSPTGDTSSVSPQDKQATKDKHQSRDDSYLPKKHSDFETKNQLINLKNALLNKHVPVSVIDSSFKFYQDYESLYGLYKLVFKAKYNAWKRASKNPNDNYISLDLRGYDTLTMYDVDKKQSHQFIRDVIKSAFRFESNGSMANGLSDKLRSVVSYAHRKASNFNKYVFDSLRSYFMDKSKHVVDKFISDIRDSSLSSNHIPIIQF